MLFRMFFLGAVVPRFKSQSLRLERLERERTEAPAAAPAGLADAA